MDIFFYIIRRILPALLSTACLSVQMFAQNNHSSEGSEFADFRKELQSEYDGFRKEINAEYIDFLSKAWKKYRLFQGKTPDEIPKPLSPVLSQEEKERRAVLVGTEEVEEITVEQKSVAKEAMERTILEKASSETRFRKVTDSLQLDYFGAELRLHYQSRRFALSAITEQSVGTLWKEIADSRFSSLLSDMLRHKEKMQMNDWAYFLLAEKVAARLSTLQSEDCLLYTSDAADD